MTTQNELVFLLDVDNTLLDDDKMQADFYRYFDEQLGHESRDRYDAILGELWDELGYCDYLGALQRYRLADVADMNNPHLLQMADFLLDYPFTDLQYPKLMFREVL